MRRRSCNVPRATCHMPLLTRETEVFVMTDLNRMVNRIEGFLLSRAESPSDCTSACDAPAQPIPAVKGLFKFTRTRRVPVETTGTALTVPERLMQRSLRSYPPTTSPQVTFGEPFHGAMSLRPHVSRVSTAQPTYGLGPTTGFSRVTSSSLKLNYIKQPKASLLSSRSALLLSRQVPRHALRHGYCMSIWISTS
ncbi:hypothetical protein EI94DRAFT_175819 [Lactarius quietus]|nr:hypothetical protein EI94DRAFT_175819 [Lactarius quietus]